MYTITPAPQNRLTKDSVKVLLISQLMSDFIGFIILGVILYLNFQFSWKEWIGWILIGITILSIIGTMWSIISPFLLYRNFRYDVNEEFLQLKSGSITEVHHLIPMTKVQSVATKQGPFLRRYGHYSVTIETFSSSHTIPALPMDAAIELRNQIAHFAKIKEVDS